jgi:hypothetical protein
MMYAKKDAARTFLLGPILDALGAAKTDEVVASIKVTKNGTVGAVDAQDTLNHNHTGHYVFVSDGGDFDTLGEVEFSLNSGTNAMAPVKFQVLPATTYDALVTNAAGGANGMLLSGATNVPADSAGTTELLTRVGDTDLADIKSAFEETFGPPYLIYTGGTVTPTPASWVATFSDGGELMFVGNEVYSTADLLTLDVQLDTTLDGTFDFRGLVGVTGLDFSYTAITVPPNIYGLTALTQIIFMGCASLATAPDYSTNTALTFICQDTCGITVPPDLSALVDLDFADFSSQPYATPCDFTHNPNLTMICYDGSANVASWPDLTGLTKLAYLDLGPNAETSTPTFAGLTSLATLNLPNTHFTTVPDLSDCPLRSLDLSYAVITSPPDLTGQSLLTVLNVSHNTDLHTAPDLSDFPLLEELWCGYTHISVIPDLAGTALRIINFYSCQLAAGEADDLFIWMAANLPHDRDGNASTAGGTNAPVTSASLAARTALSPPDGNWTLAFNE